MKQVILLVTLTSAIFVIATMTQTRDEFKQKYGRPDEHGHYIVRPGIGLSVKYAEGRKLSEMVIEPVDSEKGNISNTETGGPLMVMSTDAAESVLNEVFPPEKRGKQGNTANAEFGCASVDYTEYELVMISTSKRCERQGGGIFLIGIRWKQ